MWVSKCLSTLWAVEDPSLDALIERHPMKAAMIAHRPMKALTELPRSVVLDKRMSVQLLP